jgi:hypothetical protein
MLGWKLEEWVLVQAFELGWVARFCCEMWCLLSSMMVLA